MKCLLFSFVFVSCTPAIAASFNLEKRGQQICRTEQGRQEVCLPSATSMGLAGAEEIELIERLRVLKEVRAAQVRHPQVSNDISVLDQIGGVLVLDEAETTELLQKYSELSVRNLAFGFDQAEVRDGLHYVPFFASVKWKGSLNLNGTLHVEGFVKVQADNGEASQKDSIEGLPGLRARIAEAIEITAFADSNTSSGREQDQLIETAARRAHFAMAGTNGKTVDEATTELLHDRVAPVVFGELVYVPFQKALLLELARVFGESINRAVEPHLPKP